MDQTESPHFSRCTRVAAAAETLDGVPGQSVPLVAARAGERVGRQLSGLVNPDIS